MGHGRGEERRGEAGRDDGTRGLSSLRSNKRRVYDSKKGGHFANECMRNVRSVGDLLEADLRVCCVRACETTVWSPAKHAFVGKMTSVFSKTPTRRKFDRRGVGESRRDEARRAE